MSEEMLGLIQQSIDTGIVDQESDGYLPMDEDAAGRQFMDNIERYFLIDIHR